MSLTVYKGSYTGTGDTNTQTISLGGQPKTVFVFKNSGIADTYFKTDNMPDNTSYAISSTTATTGYITNITANGFDVGDILNDLDVTFYYIAFGGNDVFTGSYVGNATDDRDITGVGFESEIVFITSGNHKTQITGPTTDASLQSIVQISLRTNTIQQITSDGFQIGTGSNVNVSSRDYYFFCIKKSGGIKSGTYTGTGTDNRSITGIGFTPEAVLCSSFWGDYSPAFRGAETGDLCLHLKDTAQADIIQSLDSDGFTVGTLWNVDTATHYYTAFATYSETPSNSNFLQLF